MKNLFYSIVFFLFFALPVFATEQRPDMIYLDGKYFYFPRYKFPLEDYCKAHPDKAPFIEFSSTACYRGYLALYDISDAGEFRVAKVVLDNPYENLCDFISDEDDAKWTPISAEKFFGKGAQYPFALSQYSLKKTLLFECGKSPYLKKQIYLLKIDNGKAAFEKYTMNCDFVSYEDLQRRRGAAIDVAANKFDSWLDLHLLENKDSNCYATVDEFIKLSDKNCRIKTRGIIEWLGEKNYFILNLPTTGISRDISNSFSLSAEDFKKIAALKNKAVEIEVVSPIFERKVVSWRLLDESETIHNQNLCKIKPRYDYEEREVFRLAVNRRTKLVGPDVKFAMLDLSKLKAKGELLANGNFEIVVSYANGGKNLRYNDEISLSEKNSIGKIALRSASQNFSFSANFDWHRCLSHSQYANGEGVREIEIDGHTIWRRADELKRNPAYRFMLSQDFPEAQSAFDELKKSADFKEANTRLLRKLIYQPDLENEIWFSKIKLCIGENENFTIDFFKTVLRYIADKKLTRDKAKFFAALVDEKSKQNLPLNESFLKSAAFNDNMARAAVLEESLKILDGSVTNFETSKDIESAKEALSALAGKYPDNPYRLIYRLDESLKHDVPREVKLAKIDMVFEYIKNMPEKQMGYPAIEPMIRIMQFADSPTKLDAFFIKKIKDILHTDIPYNGEFLKSKEALNPQKRREMLEKVKDMYEGRRVRRR